MFIRDERTQEAGINFCKFNTGSWFEYNNHIYLKIDNNNRDSKVYGTICCNAYDATINNFYHFEETDKVFPVKVELVVKDIDYKAEQ